VGLVRDDNFDRATGSTFPIYLCTLSGYDNELGEDWTEPESSIQQALRLWGGQGLSSSERADVLQERFGQPEIKTPGSLSKDLLNPLDHASQPQF